jgi:SAM-dependent methyltransferase
MSRWKDAMSPDEQDPQADGAEQPKPPGRPKWRKFQLPEDMTGKTFLDVGCWEGANCVQAVRRGASQVVGVDLCTSDELAENVERFGFEFLQLDVLSEKWLELDTFDVVLCAGVLYHVENVISLLLRLRRVTSGCLYLETAIKDIGGDTPLMVFKSDDEVNNPSNWWVPNKRGLYAMLETCGFAEIEDVYERERPQGSRLCVRAVPVRRPSYDRVLPRKREAMSIAGGTRWDAIRKAEKSG